MCGALNRLLMLEMSKKVWGVLVGFTGIGFLKNGT